MIEKEKTMKSERVYDGRIIGLRIDTVELPNRKYSRREIVEHDNCVMIIPVTDDGCVYLVKQYRKPVDKVLLEFPAGFIDSGEEPIEAANRELQEEIGYASNNLEYIYDIYTSPGFTDEKINIYIARDLYESKLSTDEDEFVEVVKMKLDELFDKLHNFELQDSKTIIGALYLENLRHKNAR